MTYPELYIPNEIKDIFKSQPKLMVIPKEPTPPKNPKEPSMHNESPKEIIYLVILVIFGILFISFIFLMWDRMTLNEIQTYLIFTGVFLIILIARINYIVKRKKRRRIMFEEDIILYRKEIKELKNKDIAYKEELLTHEKEVEKRKSINEYELSEAGVQRHRKNKIHTFAAYHYILFEKLSLNEKIKKGASEKFFENYLRKNDSFIVHTDTKVLNSNGLYYYPDFVLVDKIAGLSFDIEIDEPYTCVNGNPIHYEENHGSYDFERNHFFKSKGWIVIRFAEKQIFEEPEACINFIINIINNLYEFNIDKISVSNSFKFPKWTKDQAHSWAYKKFRHSYIPKQYHAVIDTDNWNEQDEIERQRKAINNINVLGYIESDLPF